MAKHFVFFYFMKKLPDKIKEIVPLHVAYWKGQKLDNYAGGPFADRTGGLITFAAPGREEALAIIEKDPFITHGVVETKWVKEWRRE